MTTGNLIAGLVVMILGGLYAVRPDLAIRLQIWAQRVVMGAKYEPSSRTYKTVRVIGTALAVLGLLILTGVIE